ERLEAERLEAERLEAERLEQERVEAERLEAERLAAEVEAARLEAERLELERLDAERLAAEQEAARLEAERLAAEQAELERWAAEQAAEEVPSLEPSPWDLPPVVADTPAAFAPEELAPAASVSFADVYGTAHPTPVTPDTYDDVTAHSTPAVTMPEPEPVAVAARPTPDYSGGFIVSPEIAQPGASEGADMAALLRELSSLNSDNDGDAGRPGVAGMAQVGTGGQGQTVTRPVQAADTKAKKKKGFFGR
ncbi:MAG: hypothetical protein AB7O74_17385, partial [Candidatus Nanopelagicales bacterium]